VIASNRPVRTDTEIHAAWRDAHVKPLWENAQAHRPPAPLISNVGVWKWSVMEPLVMEAIRLATPAVAERRVLSLIDPSAIGDDFQTTTNLNAGFQIILPGEIARPHRHTMNALRFVLSGNGAITRVDGKTAPMNEGDLVITPGWSWHEHWHEGDGPIVWLDVLDVHLHINLGTSVTEFGPVHDVPALPPERAFASANVVPDMQSGPHSPVFRYPLADAVAALANTPPAADGSRRVRYVNPLTGGPVMATLDCYLLELGPGTTTIPFHTSANAVCTIVSGHGSSQVGDVAVDWEPRDVFTLPQKTTIRHHADETSRLFIVTDREVYRRLGLLTETFG
jgi:gentisate 1,2-dioxygenase